MRQFTILSQAEIDAHDNPPAFSAEERKSHFCLSRSILDLAGKIRKPSNQIRFLVLSVYFRVRKRFCGARFDERDLRHVCAQLGYEWEGIESEDYCKIAYLEHRRIILDHYGFKEFDAEAAGILREEVAGRLRAGARLNSIFHYCVEFLGSIKTEACGSFMLCKLINDEALLHMRRVSETVARHLPEEAKLSLDRLLEGGAAGRLKLTDMKRYSLSRRPKSIHANVELLKELREACRQIRPALEAAGLTAEGIRRYAGYVLNSTSFQVTQKKPARRHFHLACFLAHQHAKLQDTLVDVFLQTVQASRNASMREYRESVFAGHHRQEDGAREMAGELGSDVLGVLDRMRSVVESPMEDGGKIELIRGLLDGIQEREARLRTVMKEVAASAGRQGEAYNDFLERQSRKLLNRLGGVLSNIEFSFDRTGEALERAIEGFKADLSNPEPSLDFLGEKEKSSLRGENGKFRLPLYKTLLFVKVADAIKSGSANLKDSCKYRPLDDYLIPKDKWERDRPALLRRAGMEKFADPEKVLSELSKALDEGYRTTNGNILKGVNKLLEMKGREFTLATPKAERPEGEVDLQGLFPEEKLIPLLEILHTVNSMSSFTDSLRHWSGKGGGARPGNAVLLAVMMGYGCGIIGRIAQMSRSVAPAALDNAANWYFSEENVNAANDRLLEFMNRLRLPKIYREDSRYGSHTASDGQKFEVDADTVHATRSYKYFGRGKGVSAVNFIDERHFLFHSTVISASERESAYVIDGLMHNDVVKSDIHSTDTHGYSELVFAVTHLLGFLFAPRIKGLKRQWLYSFNKKAVYQALGYPLLPSGNINVEVILGNWDEMLRFVASVKLRVATASDLFRRLNSFSRQHAVYQGLKAFGQIVKSLFILRYIDEVEMRQSVEKELNKIESSNKLTKAIDIGNSKIEMATIEELRMAEACRRLVKNAIVCWNYVYVTDILVKEPSRERRDLIHKAVRDGSIVAWRHVNLFGEYDFSEERLKDSMGFDIGRIIEYAESA